MKTLDLNTLKIYATLYHTYRLLYCKGDMEIASNQSIINRKRKKQLIKKMY